MLLLLLITTFTTMVSGIAEGGACVSSTQCDNWSILTTYPICQSYQGNLICVTQALLDQAATDAETKTRDEAVASLTTSFSALTEASANNLLDEIANTAERRLSVVDLMAEKINRRLTAIEDNQRMLMSSPADFGQRRLMEEVVRHLMETHGQRTHKRRMSENIEATYELILALLDADVLNECAYHLDAAEDDCPIVCPDCNDQGLDSIPAGWSMETMGKRRMAENPMPIASKFYDAGHSANGCGNNEMRHVQIYANTANNVEVCVPNTPGGYKSSFTTDSSYKCVNGDSSGSGNDAHDSAPDAANKIAGSNCSPSFTGSTSCTCYGYK